MGLAGVAVAVRRRRACASAEPDRGALRYKRPVLSTVDLRDALVEALGDARRVSDGQSEREAHASDITFHRPHRPDVVVYATTTEEVSAVLALAEERNRVPVTPFGAGSSLEGARHPRRGRDLARHDAHGTGCSTSPRATSRQPCRRGRHPHGARARGGATRSLLPRRPGRGCDPRRHGSNERGRDDDRALREDAHQRPRPRGGAGWRPRRPRGQPRTQDVGGYDLLGLLIGSRARSA